MQKRQKTGDGKRTPGTGDTELASMEVLIAEAEALNKRTVESLQAQLAEAVTQQETTTQELADYDAFIDQTVRRLKIATVNRQETGYKAARLASKVAYLKSEIEARG
jgi:hypothetical protein